MLHRSPISLNVLSHDAAADMVEAVLASGVRVEAVFVDTVGDPDFYQKRLASHFTVGAGGGGGAAGRGYDITFVVAPKADSLYKTVSAGSIAAKVTRDRVLPAWVWDEPVFRSTVVAEMKSTSDVAGAGAGAEEEEAGEGEEVGSDCEGGSGENSHNSGAQNEPEAEAEAGAGAGAGSEPRSTTNKRPRDGLVVTTPSASSATAGLRHPASAGSGYPGDPTTKAWYTAAFDARFGWPTVVRFSWAPAKDFIDKHGEKVEWAEDVAVPAPGQPQLSSFFAASSSGGGPGGITVGPGPGSRSSWLKKRLLAPLSTI